MTTNNTEFNWAEFSQACHMAKDLLNANRHYITVFPDDSEEDDSIPGGISLKYDDGNLVIRYGIDNAVVLIESAGAYTPGPWLQELASWHRATAQLEGDFAYRGWEIEIRGGEDNFLDWKATFYSDGYEFDSENKKFSTLYAALHSAQANIDDFNAGIRLAMNENLIPVRIDR